MCEDPLWIHKGFVVKRHQVVGAGQGIVYQLCHHTCFCILTVDVVKKEKKLVNYFRVKVTGQTVKTENILLLSVLF